ncbi:hypothetical protein ACRC7T_18120 [Segnochrobactraceae bacterium EtOH-i3]
MTIIQSDWATGRKTAPSAYKVGSTHTARFEITLTTNVATTDIVELGVLPAFSRIIDATLIVEGAFTGTADVGIMSGPMGSTDTSRTIGNELFAAADLTTPLQRITKNAGPLLSATEADRSIGVKVSAAVTGASTKKLTLLLSYVQ